MTEREYVLGRFGESFEEFKGKKLFLYGQGAYTQAIIERFHGEYRFAAVLSDTDVSGKFHGVPLIHVDALEGERPEVVILSEHKQAREPDYERIHKACERCGIGLYDMYGLDELAVHRELATHGWKMYADWLKIVEGYDVVTFSILGSLISWNGIPSQRLEFVRVIKRLVDTLAGRGVPMLSVGRQILPRSTYAEMLVKGGIVKSIAETEKCLLMRGGEDLCYRAIRERFPGKKILHIGPGLANDGIIPRFYGIHTYLLFGMNMLPDKTLAPKKTGDLSGAQIYREAKEAIDRNQIVSFDVFDTLLMRRTLYPADVFELTERRALDRGLPAKGFAQRRRAAEREAYCGKLRDIYDVLGRHADAPLDAGERDALMALELETERSVITSRRPIADLYRYALKQGKRVVLTSDMYMPEEVLGGVLRENGITEWEKLFVSCDHGCFKWEGLFEKLKELRAADEGIVHLGDNFSADVLAAEKAGIEGIYIPSALELARQNGWDDAIDAADALADRCAVGLSVALAFENPFQTHAMKDMPEDMRLAHFGYISAPILMGYLTWLAGKLAGAKYDGVLFISRDGWLVNEFYPRLRQALGDSVLPDGMYFYMNRRAAGIAVAAEPEAQSAAGCFPAELSHGRFLRDMFGLRKEDLLPLREGEDRISYMNRHLDKLRKAAARERLAQMRYFEKCGLRKNGRYALFDFVARGTVLIFMEKYAPFDLHGLFVGQPTYVAQTHKNVEYYFDYEDSVFLNNYMEMEGALTSSEPSIISFSDEGTPVFAKEVRPAERFRQLEITHDAIREYVSAYFDLFYFPGDVLRPEVLDKIYGADGYHWVYEWKYDDWGLWVMQE